MSARGGRSRRILTGRARRLRVGGDGRIAGGRARFRSRLDQPEKAVDQNAQVPERVVLYAELLRFLNHQSRVSQPRFGGGETLSVDRGSGGPELVADQRRQQPPANVLE